MVNSCKQVASQFFLSDVWMGVCLFFFFLYIYKPFAWRKFHESVGWRITVGGWFWSWDDYNDGDCTQEHNQKIVLVGYFYVSGTCLSINQRKYLEIMGIYCRDSCILADGTSSFIDFWYLCILTLLFGKWGSKHHPLSEWYHNGTSSPWKSFDKVCLKRVSCGLRSIIKMSDWTRENEVYLWIFLFLICSKKWAG